MSYATPSFSSSITILAADASCSSRERDTISASATSRQTDVLDRIAVGARDERIETANVLRRGKSVEVILHAQHGRRIDGRSFEDLPVELAAFGQPEDLGHRPIRRVALQALDRARRQDEHPVRSLAAENLLPGIGDHIELRPIEALGENA